MLMPMIKMLSSGHYNLVMNDINELLMGYHWVIMIMHLSAAIQGIDPGELPGSFDWWSQSEHVYQIKCFQLFADFYKTCTLVVLK